MNRPRGGGRPGGFRYTQVGTGRRLPVEQLKLIAVLTLMGLVLLGLETTALSRIRIPLFGWQAAAPSLGLLFTMAVGFLHGEREGAVTGLLCGWLADAAGGEGALMLCPILYLLCGYMSGTVGKRRLAHNLPSFAVFSAVGGGLKCMWVILGETVSLRGLPPLVWIWKGLVPGWVLTVLFSAAVYGAVKGEQWLLKPKK